MDRYRLLGNSFDCKCGKQHRLTIRRFVYQPGAVDILSAVIRECGGQGPPQSALVVADCRTWQACGQRVCDSLGRDGWKSERIIVPDRADTGPVCDDKTAAWLKEQTHDRLPDIVLAVGSGVINDLCKWACFELDIPYLVVATAASMNGYAAANVAAKIAGVKVLVEARPPVAVVAEPAVIEGAPSEMTAAGFGDMIARYQSHADWVMNSLLCGEYYCAYCADMATDLEHLYLRHPEDVRQAKSEAIKGLFEALFWTGAAMTLVGTSAPASGGEHLLSHTLDMAADVHHEKHDLHGRQVGLGTILSAALYQRILALDTPTSVELPEDIDAEFWGVPSVIKAVREQYLAKRPQLEMLRAKIAQPAVWGELRTRLMTITKNPEQIKSWLLRAGGASSIADIGCSRERVRAAAMHMHEIRKRCTVVDLAWVLGILPAAVDEIIDEWLVE